jgi:mannose-1-phosphate guanylyltransferase
MSDRITTAFVFGAGLGTRLRPLTHSVPKPLIPVFQKPLITFALDHLIGAGVKSFVVNTHQLAEQFTDCFGAGTYAGHRVDLVHEPTLLETGGGIKNAEHLLHDGPFITYSGDLLTDVELQTLIDEHFRRGNDVTLALRDTGLASDIALENGRVIDIAKRYGAAGTHDFANIAVWSPGVFTRLPPNTKVSFIPIVAKWIGDGGKIGGAVLNDGHWFNIGSCADYLRVHRAILADQWKPDFMRESSWPEHAHSTAEIAPTARLLGCTVAAANCRVGPEAVLEDTILFPGAQIASRSHLSRCIVRSHQTAAGVHNDEVI